MSVEDLFLEAALLRVRRSSPRSDESNIFAENRWPGLIANVLRHAAYRSHGSDGMAFHKSCSRKRKPSDIRPATIIIASSNFQLRWEGGEIAKVSGDV